MYLSINVPVGLSFAQSHSQLLSLSNTLLISIDFNLSISIQLASSKVPRKKSATLSIVSLSYTSSTLGLLTIMLYNGWNAIANPTCQLSLASSVIGASLNISHNAKNICSKCSWISGFAICLSFFAIMIVFIALYISGTSITQFLIANEVYISASRIWDDNESFRFVVSYAILVQ